MPRGTCWRVNLESMSGLLSLQRQTQRHRTCWVDNRGVVCMREGRSIYSICRDQRVHRLGANNLMTIAKQRDTVTQDTVRHFIFQLARHYRIDVRLVKCEYHMGPWSEDITHAGKKVLNTIQHMHTKTRVGNIAARRVRAMNLPVVPSSLSQFGQIIRGRIPTSP